MTNAVTIASLLASTLALSACSAPTKDGTAITLDSTGRAPREQRLTAPAGLVVTYFASGLDGVRFMAVAPDGAVYASQPGEGRVLRLADANHDGVADGVVVAVTGMNRPHGLAFHKGALYVANTDGVVRVTLGADGTGTSNAYVNRYSGGGGHWTRTIVFGADSAMYVAVGSTCNICVESSSDRAAVLRFNEDGSGKRVFAAGLRNAVGLAVEPSTGALWASQNERDDLKPSHEDLPPEEINILTDGADYGWPYCYGDRVPNPEFANAARCATTTPPALELQAHSAPLGITFLTKATQLPEEYRGDLLVAYHGSWDRDVPTGAKVVRVRVSGGKPMSVDDFVSGWQSSTGSRWGRPVDVVVAADGAVLISDDANGAIYRLSR